MAFTDWWARLRGRSARRPKRAPSRLRLEPLEDRLAPATLDVTGGSLTYTASAGVNNNLTIGITGGSYTFTDTGETITLTPNAVNAGWSGSGTNSVSGPVSTVINGFSVNLQDGADTLSVNGPVSVAGAVALQSGQSLSLLAPITTAGNVVLTADRMDLQAALASTSGGGIVTLQPTSASQHINLDNTPGDPSGELRLSNTELAKITAGILRIGSAALIGAITIKVSNYRASNVEHALAHWR